MSTTGLDRDPPSAVSVAGADIGASAVSFGLLAVLTLAVAATPGSDWRLIALIGTAALMGVSLERASFGFSSAFRLVIDSGNPYSLRIHAVMLIVASFFFLPLLSVGSFAGQPLTGFGDGIGIAFALGAAMFGVGMQISGGCASGTLFALGGGSGKPLATIAGFVLGSTLAAWQIGFWWALPTLPPIFIQQSLGLPLGLAVQVGGLTLLFIFTKPYAVRPFFDRAGDHLTLRQRLLQGPWPLYWGALALALLNVLTLLLSGQPWGETSAFALWGSIALDGFGFHGVRDWTYWAGNVDALDRPILLDVPTLMDFGIVLGAMAAAATGGRFNLHIGGNARIWLGALLGGILMGYGARLSGGCNIGAYFSAGASGSISAWAWVLLAIAGSAIGIRLRPFFGMTIPLHGRPPVSC